MLIEKVRATSIDLCTLERCGYLAYTRTPFESAPYFTNIIGNVLVSVELLDSAEGTPPPRGKDKHPCMLLVLG